MLAKLVGCSNHLSSCVVQPCSWLVQPTGAAGSAELAFAHLRMGLKIPREVFRLRIWLENARKLLAVTKTGIFSVEKSYKCYSAYKSRVDFREKHYADSCSSLQYRDSPWHLYAFSCIIRPIGCIAIENSLVRLAKAHKQCRYYEINN